MSDLIQSIGQAPLVKGIASAAQNNPVTKFLIPNLMSAAQDVGAGLGYSTSGIQESNDKALADAQQIFDKATQTKDKAEKQKLLKLARDTSRGVSQSYTDTLGAPGAVSFQADENPLLRGVKSGIEGATGVDILAHPIGTAKGILNVAGGVVKAATHPLQTIEGAGKAIDSLSVLLQDPISALKSLPWDMEHSFKLDKQGNWLTGMGNRALAGQFKGAGKVVANPAQVAGTLADYGLTSPEKIAEASNIITGADGIAPARISRGLKLTDPVDISGIGSNKFGNTVVDNALDSATKATDATKGSIRKFIDRELTNASPGLSEGADPTKLFQTIQNIGNQSFEYSSSPALEDQQIGQALKTIKVELENRLYKGFNSLGIPTTKGLDKALEETPYTAEEIAKLAKIGNGKLAQDAQAAVGAQANRSLQYPFVQGSQMVNRGAQAVSGGMNVQEGLGSVLTAMGNPAVGVPMAIAGTRPGMEATGNVLRSAGGLFGANAGPQLALDAAGNLVTKTVIPSSEQTNQKNGNQNATDHGISVAPTSKYTISTPLESGIIEPEASFNAKQAQLLQRMGQEKITDPIQYEKDQGEYQSNQTIRQGQKSLIDESVKSKQLESLANDTTASLDVADPTFLNLLGKGWNSVLKSSNPAYAALGTQLQQLSNLSGVDLSTAATKEALAAAIDRIVSRQQSNLDQLAKQYRGGYGTATPLPVTQPQVSPVQQRPPQDAKSIIGGQLPELNLPPLNLPGGGGGLGKISDVKFKSLDKYPPKYLYK